MPVEVAGNVGRALSELPGRIAPDAWIACELSSFQLEDIDTLRCRVGVLLNVTPDHLDRHRSMDEYLRCKLRILENQTTSDTAVVNADDPYLARARLPGAGRRFWFAKDDRSNLPWPVPGLRGDHNLENALGAAAAARAAGASPEAIASALADYRPPAHRMQPVAEARGVTFVNDSKATNPDATVKALTAYEGGVRLILGGSLKGGSFVDLARAVARGPVSAQLPDRPGGADDRRPAAARGRRPPALRDARGCRPPGGRRRRLRGRRPALAGLRELRPVPRLRPPRRGVHQDCRGADGWTLTSSRHAPGRAGWRGCGRRRWPSITCSSWSPWGSSPSG